MRVLIACEFSGIVRDAFIARGHDAISCDLPSERPGPHFQGNVFDFLEREKQAHASSRLPSFDLMIAHPPCTHLAVSGAKWFKGKVVEQREALDFVRRLLAVDIQRIALENPVSVISTQIRKPDQIVQPWFFGDPETKTTCLWLKGLPLLRATDVVQSNGNRLHRLGPSPDRWKERSRTYPGIARAMAAQWGE